MQVCTSLQTDNHSTTAPLLCFLQAGCPSCCPTYSLRALKAKQRSSCLLKHCNGMHMNPSISTNVLNSCMFFKKTTTVLSLFFLKKSVCTQSTFSHTDAAPCEWVCGILDNHGPRMRQYLCNCHRSENARMAPEPHLYVVEAGRLHRNLKCLKRWECPV